MTVQKCIEQLEVFLTVLFELFLFSLRCFYVRIGGVDVPEVCAGLVGCP